MGKKQGWNVFFAFLTKYLKKKILDGCDTVSWFSGFPHTHRQDQDSQWKSLKITNEKQLKGMSTFSAPEIEIKTLDMPIFHDQK